MTTLLPDWDKIVQGKPIEMWINQNIGEVAKNHKRPLMRFLLTAVGIAPVINLRRWRRLTYTTCDRVFVCKKPR
ncbi:MAG: hypothetical protein ACFCU1_13940 [Sumerlaeia bacterium]